MCICYYVNQKHLWIMLALWGNAQGNRVKTVDNPVGNVDKLHNVHKG